MDLDALSLHLHAWALRGEHAPTRIRTHTDLGQVTGRVEAGFRKDGQRVQVGFRDPSSGQVDGGETSEQLPPTEGGARARYRRGTTQQDRDRDGGVGVPADLGNPGVECRQARRINAHHKGRGANISLAAPGCAQLSGM